MRISGGEWRDGPAPNMKPPGLRAVCHCGAVEIDIRRRPTRLTRCTCSICHRYGALWAYYTRRTARLVKGAGSLAVYSWNDRTIDFCHCRVCGCITHYESVRKADDSRLAVNARMLPPQEIAGLRIRTFDGADTWKYLD